MFQKIQAIFISSERNPSLPSLLIQPASCVEKGFYSSYTPDQGQSVSTNGLVRRLDAESSVGFLRAIWSPGVNPDQRQVLMLMGVWFFKEMGQGLRNSRGIRTVLV